MEPPEPRYYLSETLVSIANKFDWPYQDDMQDWPLEVWDKIDLERCVSEYPKLIDEDEKDVMMQGILYALEEKQQEEFQKYIPQVKVFLKTDIGIHQYTIYYWMRYCSREKEGVLLELGSIMRELSQSS